MTEITMRRVGLKLVFAVAVTLLLVASVRQQWNTTRYKLTREISLAETSNSIPSQENEDIALVKSSSNNGDGTNKVNESEISNGTGRVDEITEVDETKRINEDLDENVNDVLEANNSQPERNSLETIGTVQDEESRNVFALNTVNVSQTTSESDSQSLVPSSYMEIFWNETAQAPQITGDGNENIEDVAYDPNWRSTKYSNSLYNDENVDDSSKEEHSPVNYHVEKDNVGDNLDSSFLKPLDTVDNQESSLFSWFNLGKYLHFGNSLENGDQDTLKAHDSSDDVYGDKTTSGEINTNNIINVNVSFLAVSEHNNTDQLDRKTNSEFQNLAEYSTIDTNENLENTLAEPQNDGQLVNINAIEEQSPIDVNGIDKADYEDFDDSNYNILKDDFGNEELQAPVSLSNDEIDMPDRVVAGSDNIHSDVQDAIAEMNLWNHGGESNFDETQVNKPYTVRNSTEHYEQQIEPLRSEQQIEPLRSEQQIEPLRSEQQIEPLRYEQQIEPLRSEQQIEPLRYEQQIEPLRSEQQIEPLRYEQQIEPLRSEQQIEPLRSEQQIEPLRSEQQIEPLRFEQQIQPLRYEQQFEPLDYKQQQVPILSQLPLKRPGLLQTLISPGMLHLLLSENVETSYLRQIPARLKFIIHQNIHRIDQDLDPLTSSETRQGIQSIDQDLDPFTSSETRQSIQSIDQVLDPLTSSETRQNVVNEQFPDEQSFRPQSSAITATSALRQDGVEQHESFGTEEIVNNVNGEDDNYGKDDNIYEDDRIMKTDNDISDNNADIIDGLANIYTTRPETDIYDNPRPLSEKEFDLFRTRPYNANFEENIYDSNSQEDNIGTVNNGDLAPDGLTWQKMGRPVIEHEDESMLCPRHATLAEISHPVTALVAFSDDGTLWIKEILEQLTGIATDSIYNIMAQLKIGNVASVYEMGKRIAIETHMASEKNFERAIVFIRNPFSVDAQHKNFRPSSVDWQKSVLWNQTYSVWLNSSLPLHVITYEDFVESPLTELMKLTDFLTSPEMKISYKCAMKVAVNPPNVIYDIGQIAGIYHDDIRRINQNIDHIIQVAQRTHPDIVLRLNSYKVYPGAL